MKLKPNSQNLKKTHPKSYFKLQLQLWNSAGNMHGLCLHVSRKKEKKMISVLYYREMKIS